MIQITELQKSYKNNPVLKGTSITVKKGSVYGFIGKNGAGKSTTMNILCGLLDKDGGEVFIDGKPVEYGKTQKLGYLPESPKMYEYLTAQEYLTYISECCQYSGNVTARVEYLLNLTGLWDARNRKIKAFSRGMKQRMAMAAVLFPDPQLLILDEPTSALDPEGRAEVMEIIQSLKEQGKTILFSTHILSDVERVADTVGFLHGGRIVLESPLGELLESNQTNEVVITLKNPREELVSKIKELSSVERAFVYASGQLGVVLKNGDSKELLKTLAENDADLISYNMIKVDLEKIYLKVVKEHAGTFRNTQGV